MQPEKSDMEQKFHYYMFHKPAGCVTARSDEIYPTVLDYFRDSEISALTHVGRLDRETEGLLLLTDDGSWCHRLIHPSMNKEKEYEFLVLGALTREAADRLERGVVLGTSETPTAPARIVLRERTTLEQVQARLCPEVAERIRKNRPDTPVTGGTIVITEGKKNQIRRMMKQAGVFCIFLRRIRIAGIRLDPALRPGQYRELTVRERDLPDLSGTDC